MIVWPRGQKLHELGTPCPEYPGVTILPPKRNLVPRFNGGAKLRKMEIGEYLDMFVVIPDI